MKNAWQQDMKPILAPGHHRPLKPVYWAIQYRDPETKKLVATRGCWSKTLSPRAAMHQCFGMAPTPNFTFYNLGTTLAGARKMLRTLPD